MSIAAVTPAHTFGINGHVKGNLQHIDDTTVIFSTGSSFVLYNTENGQQKVVNLSGANNSYMNVTAMCYNHSKKILAVAEKIPSGPPAIHIFDLQTFRKKKTFNVPIEEREANVSCVVLAFSVDGKYLITQFNNQLWSLHLWVWEKAKSIGHIDIAALFEKDKAIRTTYGTHTVVNEYQNLVSTIHFSPKDDSIISISGKTLIKILKYQEGSFRSLFQLKTEIKNITSHCWMKDDRIIVSTSDGMVLVTDIAGDIKFQIIHSSPDNVPLPIHSLTTYTKGFLFGDSNSIISIFHTEDGIKKQKASDLAANSGETLRKLRDIRVCNDSCSIVSMSLAPCEDTLVCLSNDNRVFGIALNNADMKGEEPKLQLFNLSFHHGSIVAMDVCVRKPVLVTASTDHSVRVWNHNDKSCELIKTFPEDIYSLSVHPSGLYVLIGFSDKLRLMNLLLDDLRCFKEFNVRACRECRFSNGGQYFAAVQGNTIQIYSTWNFVNIANLKGHNGKVRSLYWSRDDASLISAGIDGAIYTWSLTEMGTISASDSGGAKRENEHIMKGCNYSSAVCTPDGKRVFAVGSDKMIKEIEESQVSRESNVDTQYTQILLSHSNKMMFAGTVNGSVRSIKYPFENGGHQFQEHVAHAAPIVKMMISHDDQYLFSAGEDGCIFMYKVDDKDAISKKNKEQGYADEILITKAELEEKTNSINELKARVEELKLENEYQLRLKDMNFNEKIKQVTEKFQQELDALKITSSIVKSEKEKEQQRHEEELKDEKEKHTKMMAELDTVNTSKLMSEYEKYEKLQIQIQSFKLEWQKKIEQLNISKEKSMSELHRTYEAKITEKQAEIDQLQLQLKQQLKDFEETVKETEEDSDTEIMQLKQQYELKLQAEKETGVRLKSENAIMRKRFNTLQSEIEAHKTEINKLMYEEKKLYTSIKGLEKDITSLKKEIQERDETVQDKEKRIYDLKKKNQELEKFKFVLDYKIKELKKQIEPREQDIHGMTTQIKDMDEELQSYSKDNTVLNLKISDLKLKLKAADQEITRERQKWITLAQSIKKFKIDLNDCIQSIQDPKELKHKVKKLYHKFCADVKVMNTEKDAPTEKEYLRHRDYLEHMIASMKQKIGNEQDSHISDSSRMIKENTILIHEINSIRKELTVQERILGAKSKAKWANKNETELNTNLPQI